MRILWTILGGLMTSFLTVVVYWISHGRHTSHNLEPLYFPFMTLYATVALAIGTFLTWTASYTIMPKTKLHYTKFGTKLIWSGTSVLGLLLIVSLFIDFDLAMKNPSLFFDKWAKLLVWPPFIEAMLLNIWGTLLLKSKTNE